MSNSSQNVTNIIPPSGNIIACDAITEKLGDVSRVAESLDNVLRDTQHGLEVVETNSSSSDKKSDCHNSVLEVSKSIFFFRYNFRLFQFVRPCCKKNAL